MIVFGRCPLCQGVAQATFDISIKFVDVCHRYCEVAWSSYASPKSLSTLFMSSSECDVFGACTCSTFSLVARYSSLFKFCYSGAGALNLTMLSFISYLLETYFY